MTEPRPTTLNLLVLRVADLERAGQFYAGLGLHFEKHAHGQGPEHFAAVIGGLVLELYPADADNPVSPSTRLGFQVAEIDETAARLAAIPGARLVLAPKPSEWGRRAVLADPDGHRVELVALE